MLKHSNMRKEGWFIILTFMLGMATAQLTSNECTTPDLKDGLCVLLSRCGAIQKLLNQNNTEIVRKSFCGSEKKFVKVCCPFDNRVPPTTPSVEENLQAIHFNPKASCKLTWNVHRVRFIGSQEASLGAWPWMAALGYQYSIHSRKNQNPIFWSCGGTLISSRHVLTAAHCLYNLQGLKLTSVRLGNLDFNNMDDNAITVQVQKYIIHRDYNEQNPCINDIAFVILNSIVNFNQFIQPVCLPDATMKITDMTRSLVHVVGWGFTGPQNLHSKTVLMETQAPIVSTEECKIAYRSNRSKEKNMIDDDKMLCAGYYTYRESDTSCRGDIGGPLMWSIGNQTFLIGILSYADCHKDQRTPDVYTRVSSFVDWIAEMKKQ